MNPLGVLTQYCSRHVEVSDPSKHSLTYGLSHQKRIRMPNPNHQDMLHDCAMKKRTNRATLMHRISGSSHGRIASLSKPNNSLNFTVYS